MSSLSSLPHGSQLVNRILIGDKRLAALEKAESLPHIVITSTTASDLEMIATGAYSPLTGFMIEKDYLSVINDMRLSNGLVWSIPITFAPLIDTQAEAVSIGEEVALVHDGQYLAIMNITDKYYYDKGIEAQKVYGTTNALKHPGVMRVNMFQGNILLGGDILLLNFPKNRLFPKLRLTPSQTRQLFQEKGWQTIAGFQTRNPPHRAHEYIQQLALEQTDGLFIHPLVGTTRCEEISVELRVNSYKLFIENQYSVDRVAMGLFPAAMCFAGPREAIFHALCRKNYGCTHFVVGRDHAGVGGFYEPDAAIKAFEEFSAEEIGITPLFFPYQYCTDCNQMILVNSCEHDKFRQLSGSVIRSMLRNGNRPPEEIMRPFVSDYLIKNIREKRDKSSLLLK